MKSMKVVAFLAFLLNTILFATYYAVAKEALERIDPIMFTFFEIATLAPAGLCIILLTWKAIRWPIIKQGFLLGSCLSLALFTIAIALKYTTATGTAFFPALNGFLAALIAWVFLRQPVTKATWCAGLLSTIGVTLLIMNSPMGGIRGVLIAFLGGLFFTGYVFLSDNHPQDAHTPHTPHTPHTHQTNLLAAKDRQQSTNVEMTLFGIELLTMALWACLIALLFGDWEAIHMSLPKDGLVILYVAAACTFLPTLLTVFMQKHTSPVTVSFIYILEPVFSAIIAMLYLHEMLPLYGYLGGILVVAGAIIHTSGTLWQKRTTSIKAGAAIAGTMPSISLARSVRSVPPTSETTKLLGLRHTSSVPTVASVAMGASHTAAYVSSGSPATTPTRAFTTTEPLPAHIQTHIARTSSSTRTTVAAHNGRSTYSIGAIEWVDDDICERPTRPVLDARPARATRDLSIWLNTNIANQANETQPTTPKSRVRSTEDLREISLPMRPPTHTPIPPTDARGLMPQHAKSAGKGPVWLEEDANATNISSIFSQNTIATHNYQEQQVELAEFLD